MMVSRSDNIYTMKQNMGINVKYIVKLIKLIDMKRNQEDYSGFRIYEETKALNEQKYLGKNELLVFACLYNATSKGTGPLEKGLMTDAFNRVCKQHCQVFGVQEKKIKRAWLQAILDSLIEKGFIKHAGMVQVLFRNSTIQRHNYEVTSHALETLKRLNLHQDGESSPNALF